MCYQRLANLKLYEIINYHFVKVYLQNVNITPTKGKLYTLLDSMIYRMLQMLMTFCQNFVAGILKFYEVF